MKKNGRILDSTKVNALTALYESARKKKIGLLADDNIYDLINGLNFNYQDTARSVIAYHYEQIIRAMLIDLDDPNVADTPERLARMYIDELFSGRYLPRPRVTCFPSLREGSKENLLMQGPIQIKSTCSHHWAPVIGKAWLAVLPTSNLLGLSKYARLISWIMRRPSLQENMVEQIADELERTLNTPDIALVVDAEHYCMKMRGAEEPCSMTSTQVMRGGFRENSELRSEFLSFVARNKG